MSTFAAPSARPLGPKPNPTGAERATSERGSDGARVPTGSPAAPKQFLYAFGRWIEVDGPPPDEVFVLA